MLRTVHLPTSRDFEEGEFVLKGDSTYVKWSRGTKYFHPAPFDCVCVRKLDYTDALHGEETSYHEFEEVR